MNEPKAASLEGLVQVQPDAIVSRTLIDRKAGTVTLFAFDAGQSLSEHTAPFDALVLSLEGEAEVTISGASSCLRKGEMIVLPANEPHSLQARSPFKMLLVMIRS
jgi:quercetin dioxygenase-like cupin family protein